jgi:hypothetical protein
MSLAQVATAVLCHIQFMSLALMVTAVLCHIQFMSLALLAVTVIIILITRNYEDADDK